MNEYIVLIKDLGIAGGILVGMLVALKALKNGKGCPAEPVLKEFHENVQTSKLVQEGLTEAVNRNTAAAERQTDVLAKALLREGNNE